MEIILFNLRINVKEKILEALWQRELLEWVFLKLIQTIRVGSISFPYRAPWKKTQKQPFISK